MKITFKDVKDFFKKVPLEKRYIVYEEMYDKGLLILGREEDRELTEEEKKKYIEVLKNVSFLRKNS